MYFNLTFAIPIKRRELQAVSGLYKIYHGFSLSRIRGFWNFVRAKKSLVLQRGSERVPEPDGFERTRGDNW